MKFDEVGIEIPFPHMTVYFGEIRAGTTAPAHALLNAADTQPESAPPAEDGADQGKVERSPDAG